MVITITRNHHLLCVSERRAGSVLLVSRSSKRYVSRRPDCSALKLRLCEFAFARPRYGYERLHILLRREGWHVNRKKVYRLYHEAGLMVRTKRRRKRASHLRTTPPLPTKTNERWSMDFVSDTLADSRRFRVLTAIDIFSRESLTLAVDFSLDATKVTAALDRVIARRGAPAMITIDNGTEFTSNHFDAWAYKSGIALDFIHPGRPVENGHIESFNGKLRDECLSASWFQSIEDARMTIEAWRLDYNETRPHSSLGGLPPAAFAAGANR